MSFVPNSNDDCGCNDWSQITANTGIALVNAANPNMDGTGTSATVLTANGTNGTTVKSIIIKSQGANTMGMVRLWLGTSFGTSSLFREIPIPVNPVLATTPTPPPVLPMLEFDLIVDLKLQNGDKLFATTVNGEPFTIIAEGLDWKYPVSSPACCSFTKEFASTGFGKVSTANTNTTGLINGSPGLVNIFTAPGVGSNGTLIKSITISALTSTNLGMVRLFLSSDNGATYNLWMEINIPVTTQSNFQPSYKQVFNENFYLSAGYIIAATTQIANSFAFTVEGVSWTY